MKKEFFEACTKANVLLSKGDERIRRIPLDTKRPSFEAVCNVHDLLLSVDTSVAICNVQDDVIKCLNQSISSSDKIATGMDDSNQITTISHVSTDVKDILPDVYEEPNIVPLTNFHIHASNCNVEGILMELESADNTNIDKCAGENQFTPLHCAAVSDSAECVKALLVNGKADPCIVDSHNRPPIYLASSKKVKEAFRIARAELGESYCDWDKMAKVGPALTPEMMKARRDKEAAKKRQKRERQKKQKQLEKEEKEEEEKKKQAIEKEQKEIEEAKRRKAGLKSKSSPNSCDFCSKECRRSQMFTKLDFKYCSTDCIKKHQRVLAANAAMSRLVG